MPFLKRHLNEETNNRLACAHSGRKKKEGVVMAVDYFLLGEYETEQAGKGQRKTECWTH